MAVLCALVFAMGGVACGSDSGGSDGSTGTDGSSDTGGSGDSTAQDDGSVDDSTPQVEGENTQEAPDGGGTKAVSVKLPGLPVGGDSTVKSATLQCADVGWTPEPDLPDGIEIEITGISLTPSDGFELSSESCPGDAPACTSDSFRLTASSRCSVAVAWKSGFDQGGKLAVTSGKVICEPDQVAQCKSFRDELESNQGEIAGATVPLNPPDEVTPDENGTDGTDNGETDNGDTDNGTTDNGSPDNGTTDNGSPDNGTTDNGTTDNGSPDAGSGG
jgi:hypothetical protein